MGDRKQPRPVPKDQVRPAPPPAPPRRKTRFLCVCLGGNVRSVSLAFVLKESGQDAVALGALYNPEGTFRLLADWADWVVVLAAEVMPHLPPWMHALKNLAIVEVGPDRFGSAFHPELLAMLVPVVEEWKGRNWDLEGKT